MPKVKCLSCHEVAIVAEADLETTASTDLVRFACPVEGGKTKIAHRLETPVGLPIDLEAEAKRIFGDDLVEPSKPLPEPRGYVPGDYAETIPTSTAVVDPEPTLDEVADIEGLPDVDPDVLADAVEDQAAKEDRDDRVETAYREWIATDDGRIVARSIRDRALEMRGRGWSHYGIQALAEVARFDRALEVGPDAAGYRVNNSHLSRLSRDLMAHYPDLARFFETRELRAAKEGGS